jgi:hypothetical protein
MQLIGDIHNIRDLVKAYDERLDLVINPVLGKYQVVEIAKAMRYEGDYQGHSLFSMYDKAEIALTIDFINAEKEAPDMRIIWYIREKDSWTRNKGAVDMIKEMEDKTAQIKQKRKQDHEQHLQDVVKDYHKAIVRESIGY